MAIESVKTNKAAVTEKIRLTKDCRLEASGLTWLAGTEFELLGYEDGRAMCPDPADGGVVYFEADEYELIGDQQEGDEATEPENQGDGEAETGPTPEELFERELSIAMQRAAVAAVSQLELEAQLKDAKATAKEAVKELTLLRQRGPQRYPLFDGTGPAKAATDDDNGSEPAEAATDDSEAWRATRIEDIKGVTEQMVSSLRDNAEKPIETLGDWADWVKGRSTKDQSIYKPLKGWGESKYNKFCDLVAAYFDIYGGLF